MKAARHCIDFLRFKNSQIKMVESVFAVIFFLIIIIVAVVFMSRYQTNESQRLNVEQNLKQAVQLAQSFASLPEVACSINNVVEENCIDLEKINFMDKLSKSEKSYYFDIFKYATVTLEYLNISNMEWSEEIVLYDFPKDASYSTIPVPMAVLDFSDRATGKVYFGIMNVRFYES